MRAAEAKGPTNPFVAVIRPVTCARLCGFPSFQSTVHDSIEDARTALMLYHEYVKLQRAGTFASVLEDLYAAGRASGWKVTAQ